MPIPDEVLINSYFKTPNIGNGTHWGVVKNKTYDEVDIMLMSEPEEGVDVFQKSLSIKDDLLPIDLDNKWLTKLGYQYNFDKLMWDSYFYIPLRRAGFFYINGGRCFDRVHVLQSAILYEKNIMPVIKKGSTSIVNVKLGWLEIELDDNGYASISDCDSEVILKPEEVYLLKKVLTEKDFI